MHQPTQHGQMERKLVKKPKAMHITFVFYYRSACLNLPSRTSIMFTYGCHAQPPSASGVLLDFKTCYIPIHYSRRKNLGAYSQVKNGQAGSYFKITGNLICPRFFPYTAIILKRVLMFLLNHSNDKARQTRLMIRGPAKRCDESVLT